MANQSLIYSVAQAGARKRIDLVDRSAKKLVSIQVQYPADYEQVVDALMGFLEWLEQEPELVGDRPNSPQNPFSECVSLVYED